jgi:hypothetical protein
MRADMVGPGRGDPEGDHGVAFGIRHVEQPAGSGTDVRRANADRGGAQWPAGRRVRLDPAAAYPHDYDGGAVAGGGDAAGLERRGLHGDLPAAADQGHRVRVLVAHEDHGTGGRRVVWLTADLGVRHHPAARQGDLE